jgi:hypothetical protein
LVYSKCRERMLELCRVLVKRSREYFGKPSSHPLTSLNCNLESPNGNLEPDNIGAKEAVDRSIDDSWFTALDSYVTYQVELLGNMRDSLESTYKVYKPDVSVTQIEALFYDKSFRDVAMRYMRNPGIASTRSETPDFWIEYAKRFRNYDRLKLDLEQTRHFLSMAMCLPESHDIRTRDIDIEISARGDVILQFSNLLSPTQPVLRFRVSSHMLMAASPYFSRILAPSNGRVGSFEEEVNTPSPPRRQICNDGATVKVYRMVQNETNKYEALTTLLHACHFNNDKVPREVTFEEFVSIAEVCLRYECTSPLENIVDCRWLQQWMHKANDSAPDGMLLISYVFGLRNLFTRTSKTVILNTPDYSEPESQALWPSEVKQKILAVRFAKIAQIYAACVSAVEDYYSVPLNPPITSLDSVPPLKMSSVPKCPKGSHQCDAMNLGWLMLTFNELGILPNILSMVNGRRMPSPPGRSINDLVDCLRKLPSAPQVHTGGVCDHIAAFRGSMNDIYNSIKGLTFWDVCGKGGWALSRHHDISFSLKDKSGTEIFELPAPVEPAGHDPINVGDDDVTLNIMAQLDDLQDLQSAAMIDKGFYTVYKKHELFLIKTVLKASRKRGVRGGRIVKFDVESGQARLPLADQAKQIATEDKGSPQHLPTRPKGNSISLLSVDAFPEDIVDISPPQSPTESGVNKTPWIESNTPTDEEAAEAVLYPDRNLKFLSGDFVHLDKALVIEGRKHLRVEQDRNLGSGPQSEPSSSP